MDDDDMTIRMWPYCPPEQEVALWIAMHGSAQRVHDFKQFYVTAIGDDKANLRYTRESDVVMFDDPKVDIAWRCYEMGSFETLHDVRNRRMYVSEYVMENYLKCL